MIQNTYEKYVIKETSKNFCILYLKKVQHMIFFFFLSLLKR